MHFSALAVFFCLFFLVVVLGLFFSRWINCVVSVALNRDASVRDDCATEMFDPKLYASVTVVDFIFYFYRIVTVIIIHNNFYPE